MNLVIEHRGESHVAPLCAALGVARSSLYRRLRPACTRKRRPLPARALSAAEETGVLAVLHEPRFADLAPPEVYATLLDEGRYLCSVRTMYRILAKHAEVRERRNQIRHGNYPVPELLASRPNEVWSWDITKLAGPAKWTYYYLYVIIDIYSRYVVGWMVAHRESAALAKRLISATVEQQGIAPGQLTVHADRGSSMRSKPVALMLADLGVTKTHSRPYVSNDNPYSESHFKTLKYRPDYPQRFGSLEHARAFQQGFFDWYAHEHHHNALGLLTPHDVHYGHAAARLTARTTVLNEAYVLHPERFVRGAPRPTRPPEHVWINRPQDGARRPPQVVTGKSDTPEVSPPAMLPQTKVGGGRPTRVAPLESVA